MSRMMFVSAVLLGVSCLSRADGLHAEPRMQDDSQRVVSADADAVRDNVMSADDDAPLSLPFFRYRIEPELETTACSSVDPETRVRGPIDQAVLKAAREQLNLPMGFGRRLTVKGKQYLFCTEPHYHDPGYTRGPEGWHKGITVYEAT